MIHVRPQPAPATFNQNVRQKGLKWLKKNNIALNQPLPPGTELKPYWRGCLDDLHASYQGCCAYLAVHVEMAAGGVSVDHYIPKSQRVDLAYEWSNYRLASSRMNSRKGQHTDVLDPFKVKTGWFRLELITGRIYPASGLPSDLQHGVQATIVRLGLDDGGNRALRTRHYDEYIASCVSEAHLRKHSPFVWSEAKRQGCL